MKRRNEGRKGERRRMREGRVREEVVRRKVCHRRGVKEDDGESVRLKLHTRVQNLCLQTHTGPTSPRILSTSCCSWSNSTAVPVALHTTEEQY